MFLVVMSLFTCTRSPFCHFLLLNLGTPLSPTPVTSFLSSPLCGTNNLFTDSPTDIADYIVNIGSCLLEKSGNIKALTCGLIPGNESWSVNSLLIKEVNRTFEYLYLKHDFSFIDQNNGWTLPNGDLYPYFNSTNR